MARNTTYVLYATGRTDATYNNIWAFSSATERVTFLNGKSPLFFEKNKYWRVGTTIKCAIDYESSFKYDYVMIINKAGTTEAKTWYAFITGRMYISPNVTEFTLDVDYVQTFYFVNNVPFWNCSAFITKTTAPILPPRGIPSDFPVPEVQAANVRFFSNDYVYVIYSTVNVISLISGETRYTALFDKGIFMVAAPYLARFSTSTEALNGIINVINAFNSAGLTDAIEGIYAFPAELMNDESFPWNTFVEYDSSYVTDYSIIFSKPTSISGYQPRNKVLLGYDYTYVVVSNGQGETSTFNFEDFANEQIELNFSVSLLSGYPTIIMRPVGYLYGDENAFRYHLQKITTPLSCSYLNDTYRIWLAQTQNSRAAAIDQARAHINQAETARNTSLSYQVGQAFDFNALLNVAASASANITETVRTVGETTLKSQTVINPWDVYWGDVPGQSASTPTARTFGGGTSVGGGAGRTFGRPLSKTQLLGEKIAGAIASDDIGQKLGGLATLYAYNHLGMQQAASLDAAVENSQLALNSLLASYKDKARIPATAAGSNAYGDLAYFQQYGFIACIMMPTVLWAYELDEALSAGGHTVNTYTNITKTHKIFDYVQGVSPKIPVDVENRPQYARNLLMHLIISGVYLWYVVDGDISPWIGSPNRLNNEEV